MNRPGDFLAELKRRRVFRVAVVYVVGGWAIVQAATTVFPVFDLPGWVARFVVLLVALGLPLTLALAWAFDSTPEDAARTEDAAPEQTAGAGRSRGAAIAVLGGAAFIAVAAGLAVTVHDGGSGPDSRRVVVAIFENRTGDASLEPLGRMAADWITRGLTEAGSFEVADAPLSHASQAAAPGQDAALFLAGQNGAGTVVSGAYYRQGDTLLVTARIRDVLGGEVLREVGPVRAPVGEPLQAVERLGGMISGGLAALLDTDAPPTAGAGRQPPAYEAYRAFLEGEAAFYRSDEEEAIRHYRRAVEIDPLYVAPVLREAAAHNNRDGACAPILVAGDVLAAAGARPSEYERHHLASMEARCRGDAEAAYRAGRRMAELAPGSEWTAYYAAVGAIDSGRAREGVEALQRLDPARGFLARVALYYEWLARGLHALEEYEQELEAAERGRLQHPGHPDLKILDLRPLAALGRGEELERRLADVLAGQLPDSSISDVVVVAEELSWHGHPELSRSLAERAVERMETGPGRVRALIAAGRVEEARALADSLSAAGAGAQVSAVRGVLAAWLGERAAAERALEEFRRLEIEELGGRREEFQVARVAILTRLGRRDEAMRELRRWGPQLGYGAAHANPALEPLRGHPLFEALLRERD